MSTNQIEIAKAIATIAHLGQTDKAGNPYIDHPRRVAEKLAGRDERVIAAGWLHDVLEDTSVTRDDLHAAGIDWTVIGFVEEVTRRDGQTPEEYYEGITTSGAHAVKLADIADNTNPDRLALLDDATIARLTRKYAKARLLLGATS